MSTEGLKLQTQFEEAVTAINQHTKDLGNKYCECPSCRTCRQRLNFLSEQMLKIGYQRQAMF